MVHDIEGVHIPFDANWKNVAVSVSGGADSALLAYLICDLIKDQPINIHIINHVRMWKTRPWQQYDGKRVYDWLHQKFCNAKFLRHVNFIAPDIEYGNIGASILDEYNKFVSGDNIQQRAYAEFICYAQNIDAYYNAVTRNPRNLDLGGMHERNIEPTAENKHLEFMIHMGKVASHPFRFVDKAWIVSQYKRLGIMELFDITRSCEGEFKDIDYQTYQPGQPVPHCGKCFWCQERSWALAQNGLLGE